MREILTVQELAERLKVPERTVRQAITAGRLRAAKVGADGANGGPWRIAVEDARACFDASAQPTLKALYREFQSAKSARIAANATAPVADRAN